MSTSRPPRAFARFFKWYCKDYLYESIMGDIEEQYDEDVKLFGIPRARRRFAWTVIRFFRKDIIKPIGNRQKLNNTGMLKHNLLITFRGFLKHKTVFGINLIGLIASLTCVLFSSLWINDEMQKDRFHDESEKLFQVYTKFLSSEGVRVWRGITGLIEPEIQAQIPEAEISTVFTDTHEYTLNASSQGFKVRGRFADEDFLKVFNYPLISGEKHSLNDPSNILITRSLAERLFGTDQVLEKTITWNFKDMQKSFRVAGILEDVSPHSTETFEFILPWIYYHDELINYRGWGNFYGRVVVKLDPEQKPRAEAKINEIFQKNVSDDQIQLFLTSYADRYLYGNYEDGVQSGGRIDYVKLTAIVALFILLIACINFINLSTAFSTLKIKEIGVKKTFGVTPRNLAFQFFSESTLLSFIAMVVASLLVAVLIGPFNQLTGKQLSLSLNPVMIGVAFLFIPVIGLIAGAYPAVYLSKIEVVSALKSKFSGTDKKSTFGRQTLVFIQFTLSIILIVGTLIVGKQVDYALTKNLGYDRDNLLYFRQEGALVKQNEIFVAELQNLPGVLDVSRTSFSVGPEMQNRTQGLSWEGKREDQQIAFWENNGDKHSVSILGMEFIAGRNFSEDLNEENSVIFNQTAIDAMGFENPIGQVVEHYSGRKKIIGVVKDFTTESLHSTQEPAMFFYRPERTHYIMAKVEKGRELQTIQKMEELFKKYNPLYPFEPNFVDSDYEAMYHSEMRVAKLSRVFALLAILISCLGLFGLTTFGVRRRVKEIGIRKVLGADSLKLAISMTYSFTKAVFVALIVALPVSYFLGLQWLQNFADSIDLSWWMFALAGLIAICISWATIASQTIKAVSSNPAEILKDE